MAIDRYAFSSENARAISFFLNAAGRTTAWSGCRRKYVTRPKTICEASLKTDKTYKEVSANMKKFLILAAIVVVAAAVLASFIYPDLSPISVGRPKSA